MKEIILKLNILILTILNKLTIHLTSIQGVTLYVDEAAHLSHKFFLKNDHFGKIKQIKIIKIFLFCSPKIIIENFHSNSEKSWLGCCANLHLLRSKSRTRLSASTSVCLNLGRFSLTFCISRYTLLAALYPPFLNKDA